MQSAFGVQFPAGTPPNEVVAVHPTQLYEVLMGAIMFFIVLRFRKHSHGEGWLFGLYCLLAGLERFIVEFFRAKDDRFLGGGLTVAQLIAIGFALFGAIWMTMRWSPSRSASVSR
jgi:phosphatidylglycerol:prolipoprotein diacylglycerol transferase